MRQPLDCQSSYTCSLVTQKRRKYMIMSMIIRCISGEPAATHNVLYGSLVALMLRAFPSTAELEQNFAFFQMLFSRKKPRTSNEHLRSLMKNPLDGTEPADWATRAARDDGSTCRYVPRKHCSRTQQLYLPKFGRKSLSQTCLPGICERKPRCLQFFTNVFVF